MTKLEIVLLLIVIVFSLIAIFKRKHHLRLAREETIRRYTFSASTLAKLQQSYPNLEDKDLPLVARALRQYFLIFLRAEKKTISMPSKVVDVLWHEFILDTRRYTEFCKQAFGDYFHHIPASPTQNGTAIANSMKLTLRLAFLEENINPNKPTRLPLLFAIDEKLGIPDGHFYQLPQSEKMTTEPSSSGCAGIACAGSSSTSAPSSKHGLSDSAGDNCIDGASDSTGDTSSSCSSGCSGGCGGSD